MLAYLGKDRVCDGCRSEMVPACDVRANAGPRELKDGSWLCLGCGRRLPTVLLIQRRTGHLRSRRPLTA
jgi:hypothetical protein